MTKDHLLIVDRDLWFIEVMIELMVSNGSSSQIELLRMLLSIVHEARVYISNEIKARGYKGTPIRNP